MWKELNEFLLKRCVELGAELTEFSILGGKKVSAVVELRARMIGIEVLDDFVYDCQIIEISTEKVVFVKTRELANFEELREAISADLTLAAGKRSA
jgi:hypothetical protein